MTLIDRYIGRVIFSSIGLVTVLLTGLQIFVLFVNQLGDLGKGKYTVLAAAHYVVTEVPYEVYLFFPMASLLGCLIGLGILANHRELVVMRASGLSILQITRAVFKVAFVLIFIVTVVGEFLLPHWVHQAHDQKMQALMGDQALRTAQGIWLRYRHDFINIGQILPNNRMERVYQFHFTQNNHLAFARQLDSIEWVNDAWLAHGVHETQFDVNEMSPEHVPMVKTQAYSEMIWPIPLKPSVLRVGDHEADEMTLPELRRYLRAQKRSHQRAQNYQLVYWQRIVQPLTTAVMMLLAIPFIFGPLRSSTMGSKLLVGATVGFGFYISNRFLGSVSQVYQFSPILAAFLPTVICASFGLYLMMGYRR